MRGDLFLFYKSLGRHEEVIGQLESISRLDKYFFAQIYFMEAGELFYSGRLEEASSVIDLAIEINSFDSRLYCFRHGLKS